MNVISRCLLSGLAISMTVKASEEEEEDASGGEFDSAAENQEDPYKKYWIAHGICASLAWAIIVPLAICSAVLRRQFVHAGFSEGAWFQVHRALNSLAAILTIIAFSLAVYVIRQEDMKSNWTEIPHFTVGLVIFIVTLLQVTLAFFRPKQHTHTSGCTHSTLDEPKEEKDEKPVDPDIPEEKSAAQTTPVTDNKSLLLRRVWEHKHRYFGYGLLATAWWQLQDGWHLYEEEIGGTDLGAVFLATAAGISGMGLIVYSVHKAGEWYGNKN